MDGSAMMLALGFGAGAVMAAATAVVVMRSLARAQVGVAEERARGADARAVEAMGGRREVEDDLRAAHAEVTRLTALEAAQGSRIEELLRVQQSLRETFAAMSAEALRSNNETFIQLARAEFERLQTGAAATLSEREMAFAALLDPIREGLGRYESKIDLIERERARSFGTLTERLEAVAQASASLQAETRNLSKALRTPTVRGRWGEVQLKRVVEIAGMLDRCDFTTQTTTDGDRGRLRPDMVVRVPGGKTIVVDAKAPMVSFLDAAESADDDARQRHLAQHARALRAHVDQLSRKAYWDQFEQAPEFVICFLPAESLYSHALEQDPTLIEQSVDQRVVLATPTTLIALLKAVAFGWRQDAMTRHALDIQQLGREIYERLAVMAGHVEDVGAHLGKAVGAYNKAVGSLETRVLVSARRFRELEVIPGDEIAVVGPLETVPRALQAPELRPSVAAVTTALPGETDVSVTGVAS